MDSSPSAYRDGRYTDVFEAARSNRLRPDDMVEYRKSLDRLRDIQRGIKYETENARRKALEEGRAEEKIEIARKMISSGINTEMISDFSGLSESEI